MLLAATTVCQALPSKKVVGTVALSGLKVTTPVGIAMVAGPAPPSKVSVWAVMPMVTDWLVASAVVVTIASGTISTLTYRQSPAGMGCVAKRLGHRLRGGLPVWARCKGEGMGQGACVQYAAARTQSDSSNESGQR